MPIRIIPAQPASSLSAHRTSSQSKINVAAYCRVSTEMEEQESSYESQMRHYTELISETPSWELAGIYADEGITGTQAKKRPEFLRMIEDCEAGKIDLVVTKSISRFARNTLECLQYIRLLKERNIAIFFEKENINTLDSKGELLITIMASIAQQESLSISQNVRMGIQYRFQQGKPMINHTWFLGYTKDQNGDLVIVPEEADIVRRIFRDYLEGLSYKEIVKGLELDGIKTGAGRDKWYDTTIISMLKNEKYMGDLLLQKTYTQDVLTKRHLKNDGRFPQYYVQNAHEPIVPREIFTRVRGEMLRRENKRLATGKKELARGDLGLNKRMVCSECGTVYRRVKAENPEMNKWRCRNRTGRKEKRTCSGRIVEEKLVHEAVLTAFNRLPAYKEILVQKQEQLHNTLSEELKGKLEEIERQLDRFEEAMSEFAETGRLAGEVAVMFELEDWNTLSEGDVAAKMKEKLDVIEKRHNELLSQKAVFDIQEMKIAALLELIDEINEAPEKDAGMKSPDHNHTGACRDVEDFFRRTNRHNHHGPVTVFSDDDVIRYVEKITIFPDKMAVRFKAGLEIDVREM